MDKVKALFGRMKGSIPLIIMAAVGIILLCLPSGGKKSDPQPVQASDFSLEAEEKRLAQLLSRVEGAGDVSVMLTLAGSERTVLARDEKPGQYGVQTETVLISGGGAVTTQVISPEYRGAVVVARGADSARVRLELTRAVAAATGLSADKISVLKMK